MSQVQERVQKIIEDLLGVKDVALDASFVDDLGADSLHSQEFMMELEDAFQIVIPDEVAAKIVTVQDAINVIEAQLKEKEANG